MTSPPFKFPDFIAKCNLCRRYSVADSIGDECGMPQPTGQPCLGLFEDIRKTKLDPDSPREKTTMDNLDIAQEYIDTDAATDGEGVSYALRAIALTMLWQAKQQREAMRQVAEAHQLAKEWREAQPPPPPTMPYPLPPGYQGF